MVHGLPPRKRRSIAALEKRLDGKGRAALRRALARDVRDGKLERHSTHLAKFLAARGL